MKEQFQIEYLLKTSPRVLENAVTTTEGLAEWFADHVKSKDKIYHFNWNGSEEVARLISLKSNDHIRWKWLNDEEEELDTFFELKYNQDSMTGNVILKITDFAEDDEVSDQKQWWESQVTSLKRYIGA